jgi:hypothetical protein
MTLTCRALAALVLTGAVAACTAPETAAAPEAPPSMRWDFHPEAPAWTAATLSALATDAAQLDDVIPADVAVYCPAYAEKSEAERRAFWAGLFSALAKHESTWNPAASGGGGRWIGLLQISPATADHYGCEADTPGELKNGVANLACAVRIAARQVLRDGLVAGNGAQGVGRDWAPFRSAAKRADIAAWTRAQSYCR